jgi:hypothetical protein
LSSEEIQFLYQSNIAKFNSSEWIFTVNQSSLSFRNYDYSVSACDTSGLCNSTETRSLTIIQPTINLTLISPLISKQVYSGFYSMLLSMFLVKIIIVEMFLFI